MPSFIPLSERLLVLTDQAHTALPARSLTQSFAVLLGNPGQHRAQIILYECRGAWQPADSLILDFMDPTPAWCLIHAVGQHR